MDDLLSNDEKVRQLAIQKISELAEGEEFETHIDRLLEILLETQDEFTRFQISSAISNYFTKFPGKYGTYDEKVREVVDTLAEGELSDNDLSGAIVLNLVKQAQGQLQMNEHMLLSWLPTLFKLTSASSSIKYSASAPIISIAQTKPALLKDYVADIFVAINNGFTTLLSSLIHLYPYDPDEFQRQTGNLFNLMRRDPNSSSIALMILNEISKNAPNSLLEFMAELVGCLHNPSLSSIALQAIGNIAEKHPEAVQPYLETLAPLPTYNTNLLYQIPNILGLIGNLDQSSAERVLEILNSYMPLAPDNAKPMILSEFRNIGEKYREVIAPYIEVIRSYESSPQETIRDQARLIVDTFEGRDIRSLAATIDEQNERIAQAATSFEDLMAYIDDNIAMLKEFIAEFSKKLPTPRKFSTEGRIRKTLILHFVCDREKDRCLFPEERPFTTETKEWSKWLKIAFSAVKLGKSLIIPASAGGAGKAVKEAYDAYREKYDQDFLAYISQPFLTSEEQDKLIIQLREAKFFDVFTYDPQTAGWVCTMCNL